MRGSNTESKQKSLLLNCEIKKLVEKKKMVFFLKIFASPVFVWCRFPEIIIDSFVKTERSNSSCRKYD